MRSRHPAARALAAAAEVGWWWGCATGIWLLTLSSVTGPDLWAAIGCGLPCGLAARAGRHAMSCRWLPRPGWARWLLPLPAAVITDTGRLLLVALRGLAGDRQPGRLREVALARAERPDTAAAHRALAALAISLSPGTFVLESDPEENKLVIHALTAGWPHPDRVVSR